MILPVVKIGENQLYYEVDGTGDELLLIHSVRGSIPNWQYVRPLLRKHFRLILPELRGHGRSSMLTEVCDVELFSNDMIALLDDLGIEQCIVAGHSFGGFTAQQLTLDAPKRVRALILILTAPMTDTETALAEIELGKLAYEPSPETAVEKFLEYFYNPEKIRGTPGMMELLLRNFTEAKKLDQSHGCAQGAASRFDIRDQLEQIIVPTLVLQGSHDKSFPPKWADYYREHLPHATIHIIEETSHQVHLEQPEALAKAIKNFYKSLT